MLKDSLTNCLNLWFSGLDAPVLLKNAEELLPLVEQVLPAWPFVVSGEDAKFKPCITISGQGGGVYLCQSDDPYGEDRFWDAVNAVCELVVSLAWAQIRANPSWLCLHCAAVEFDGKLVLFPNRRRSGKSTLTAVLAQRGYRVFTDDFLPVFIDRTGAMLGVANGINPRLRLPIPDGFRHNFREWVADRASASNTQYAYLGIENLAVHGETLPIGAVVVLDRQDDFSAPQFQDIQPAELLDDLITQNFARLAHSGRILSASHAVAQSANRYRLSYDTAEQAATLLERKFKSWPDPTTSIPLDALPSKSVAKVSIMGDASPEFDTQRNYIQAAGATEARLGDQLYVADAHGISIHRLNSGSSVIWTLLEEPASLADIVDILSAAFPDQSETQIRTDCTKSLQQFAQGHLIMPTSASKEKAR